MFLHSDLSVAPGFIRFHSFSIPVRLSPGAIRVEGVIAAPCKRTVGWWCFGSDSGAAGTAWGSKFILSP